MNNSEKEKKSEFFKLMLMLRKTYGTNSYPDAVISVWWEEIGHVNTSKLRRAINRTIADCANINYPPKLTKVEAMLSQIREDTYKKEKKFNSQNALSTKEIRDILREMGL